jgi:hypothetical protein
MGKGKTDPVQRSVKDRERYEILGTVVKREKTRRVEDAVSEGMIRAVSRICPTFAGLLVIMLPRSFRRHSSQNLPFKKTGVRPNSKLYSTPTEMKSRQAFLFAGIWTFPLLSFVRHCIALAS